MSAMAATRSSASSAATSNLYSTVLTVLQENSSFEDVSVQGAWFNAMTSSKTYWPAWKRAAMDVLAGGVVLAKLARGLGEQRIRHVFWGAASGETPIDPPGDLRPISDLADLHRLALFALAVALRLGGLDARGDPQPARGAAGQEQLHQHLAQRPDLPVQLFAARMGAEDYDQIRIGSVLYDLNTGSVFFVKAITGGDPNWTIQAELQNGFRIASGGSVTLERSFSAGSGLMRAVARACRAALPHPVRHQQLDDADQRQPRRRLWRLYRQ